MAPLAVVGRVRVGCWALVRGGPGGFPPRVRAGVRLASLRLFPPPSSFSLLVVLVASVPGLVSVAMLAAAVAVLRLCGGREPRLVPRLRPGRGPRERFSLEFEKLSLDRVAFLPRRPHHRADVVLLPRGSLKLAGDPKVVTAAARIFQSVANLIGDELGEVRVAFPRENLFEFGWVSLRVENLHRASTLNLVNLLLPRRAFLALHETHAQLLAVVVLEHVVVVVPVELPERVVREGFRVCSSTLLRHLEVLNLRPGPDVTGKGRGRVELGAFDSQATRVLRGALLRAVPIAAQRLLGGRQLEGRRGQRDGLAPRRGGENVGQNPPVAAVSVRGPAVADAARETSLYPRRGGGPERLRRAVHEHVAGGHDVPGLNE